MPARLQLYLSGPAMAWGPLHRQAALGVPAPQLRQASNHHEHLARAGHEFRAHEPQNPSAISNTSLLGAPFASTACLLVHLRLSQALRLMVCMLCRAGWALCLCQGG